MAVDREGEAPPNAEDDEDDDPIRATRRRSGGGCDGSGGFGRRRIPIGAGQQGWGQPIAPRMMKKPWRRRQRASCCCCCTSLATPPPETGKTTPRWGVLSDGAASAAAATRPAPVPWTWVRTRTSCNQGNRTHAAGRPPHAIPTERVCRQARGNAETVPSTPRVGTVQSCPAGALQVLASRNPRCPNAKLAGLVQY